MPYRPIKSLDELMDGGVNERFNAAFTDALENAMDPDTASKKARKVILTITIQPNEKRDAASFAVDVKTNLAPPVPLSQTVLLNKADDGSVTATEITGQVPGQLDLDGAETVPNIVKFGGRQQNSPE